MQDLFERAKEVIPGGVNSPVRAFLSVGGTPRFIRSAQGARMRDEQGKEYLDFVGSWGPMILGHNHPAVLDAVCEAAQNGLSFGAATRPEVELAELFCAMVSCADMVRMVNSGTEAVMSAIRVARGFTGRDKVVKFDGCYHGHSDAMLVRAGSGVMTAGNASSAGVPNGCTQDTVGAAYNDIASVQQAFDTYPGEIAAVIVEPVAANMGVVVPEDGFLQALRDLCTAQGALLIFDEVITGFRLSAGGAQQYYGVTPDMAVFGKIIGGGMPVGAYCGRREIMECIAPLGGVYQAGTLSGNPVAMAAGLAQLTILQQNSGIYDYIEELGNMLRDGLTAIAQRYDAACAVSGVGSLSCAFFAREVPRNYQQALQADTGLYAAYFNFLLERGVYLAPAQFEAMFVSAAHTPEDIDLFLQLTDEFWKGRTKA